MTEQAADRSGALAALGEVLGVAVPADLLDLAMTHRSYSFEHGGVPTNERLEFLGDSVLGLAITSELYRRHPDRPEGELARMRASVVNTHALAELAATLGLGECLLLGRGESASGGRTKASILADTLEAVLGAVFLTTGYDRAADVVLELFAPLLTRAADLGAGLDWKTSLQELTSRLGLGVPTYDVVGSGPDHARIFTAGVIVAGEVRGQGDGSSKKVAEQRAAEAAWRALNDSDAGGQGPDGN